MAPAGMMGYPGIAMADTHIADSQLERYAAGLVFDDAEIRWIEDHLFQCGECTERLWAIQEHLDDPESGSGQTDEPDLYRGGGPLQ